MTAVWCADDTFLDQLIFLNDSNLVVDSPKDEEAPRIKEALLGGTPAAQLLSSDSIDIPLLSITSIQTDRNDEDIEIFYKVEGEEKTRTLRMASPEKRDEVYTKLKAAFGDRFTESEHQYSVPRAAFGSLASLTTFGLLTWGGAKFAALLRAAEDYDIEGSRQGTKQLIAWVLEWLGPTGVYIVGGLFCALSALVLYQRVTSPQSMLIFQETPYKRSSRIKLGLKYLALIGVWYLVLRIVL